MAIKKFEITVGLFVVAGIAAFVMLALSMGNSQSDSGNNLESHVAGYEVKAHFDNIGNLKLRAPVTASGVRIGQVSDIAYNSESYEAVVTLTIESRYDRFPVDTAASVLTVGLMGEQYVALEPGAEIDFLQPGDKLDITQSALVLEQIIGQLLYSVANDKNK